VYRLADKEYQRRVEEQLKEMESSAHEEDEDEEAKELRLAEERKRRRLEMLKASESKTTNFTSQLSTSSASSTLSSSLSSSSSSSASSASSSSSASSASSSASLSSNKMDHDEDLISFDKITKSDQEELIQKAQLEASKLNGEQKSYDIFVDSPSLISGLAAPAKSLVQTGQSTTSMSRAADADFDDPDGYYRFRLGDTLASKFEVFANQGRGVFSTVLRVRDLTKNNQEFVIKIIRNNETMRQAGAKGTVFFCFFCLFLPCTFLFHSSSSFLAEKQLCELISQKDPENKRHCVRLLSSFEHRNHL
jgi:serine/threonine-protein kinase PRP4